ncbi:MAG: hypothetical protein LBT01_09465 [Spirochaetaceae bacterium]|jgi:DNA repair exonuclease SbcCD ATPase subunit|nr:hypothetical protein [Spirochaetaceae bacterium]
MELFTFGNLFAIIVPALFLVIYRLLDRRNRNLDAASKYGKQLKDALKEELSEYIEKKKADIYDYGAILDAEKFSAKAILANIEEKEGCLSKKSDDYDKLNEKLHVYDASLSELVKMTERVETNLFRIQEESSFVENVAVQIAGAEEKSDELSKKLAAVSGKIEGEVERSVAQTHEKIDALMEAALRETRERATKLNEKMDGEFRAEMEERIQTLKENTEAKIAALGNDLSRIESSAEKINTLYDEVEQKSAALESDFDKKIEEHNERAGQLDAAFRQDLEKSADRTKNELRSFESEIADSCAKIATDYQAELHEIKMSVSEIETTVAALKKEAYEKTDEHVQRFEAEFTAALEKRRESVGAQLAAWRDEITHKLSTMSDEQEAEHRKQEAGFAENLRKHISELDDKFRKEMERLSGMAAAFETSIDTQIKIAQENINSSQEEIQNEFSELRESTLETLNTEIARIGVESADKIKRFVRDFEKEQSAMKEQVIEKNTEVDRLLLQSQGDITAANETVAALKGSIENINGELEKQRAAIMVGAEEKVQELDAMLRTTELKVQEFWTQTKHIDETMKKKIEHELQELRENTLENLNAEIARVGGESAEKIKKFVRDFENEQSAVKEQVIEKNTEVDRLLQQSQGDIAALNETAGALRTSIENINSELEKQRAASILQAREKAQELDEMLKASELKLQEFLTQTKHIDETMAKKIEHELHELRESSLENLNAEIARVGGESAEKIKKFIRDFEKEQDAMKEQVIEKNTEVDRLLQQSQGDIAAVNETVAVLRSSIEIINGEIEKQRAASILQAREKAQELDEMLKASELKLQEFLAQTKHIDETMAKKIEHELHELRESSLENLNAEIARVGGESAEKIKKFIRDFEKEQGAIREQVTQKNEDIDRLLLQSQGGIAETNETVAVLKSSIETINGEIEKQRAAAITDAREKTQELDAMLQASEMKLREFFDQTKLIDKTIEMKNALQDQIEDVQSDISRLELQKSDISTIERQLSGVKRLEDEVNVKMSRFLGEQRRIELMEDDFNRLLQTSRSVEDKLTSLTENSDALQDMQLKFRKLSEAMSETEEKYQRIEKKNQILDETSESIDKNFKHLQESEKTANQFAATISQLSGELAGLRAAMDNLVKDNSQILEAAEKVSSLDTMLGEVETRLENMQKVREWCTDLEARLLELNQQAHNEVKRAGESLKKESGRANSEQGAPPLNIREDVIKLKRMGWTTDDIARSLKLAKSSVELILETAPKDTKR